MNIFRKLPSYQLVVSILFVLLLASCHRNRIYNESLSFDNYKWLKSRPVIFQPEITNETVKKPLKLNLNIRYIQGFPYKFLHLRVYLTNPKGESQYRDISIQIISDETTYNGEGAGDYWDLDYTVDDQMVFEMTGKYKIQIIPFMQDDPVNFIDEIGLSLEKVNKD